MADKILVVDDQPEEAEVLTRHLRSSGFHVLLATGASAALALIRSERPGAIICDLEMPDQDGYDLLEAVALDPATHSMPFILANRAWGIGNWSLSRGGRTADAHVPKPYPAEELAGFLTRLLQKQEWGNEVD